MSLAFHNDCLAYFKENLYKGMFTIADIRSNKKMVKYNDIKYYGYFFEKNKEMYFFRDEYVKQGLPLKEIKKKEIDYKGDVFYFVLEIDPIVIPNKQELSFRDLINTISDFEHSSKIHYILHKIISVVALTNRINYRTISTKGFGKDSVVCNLNDLIGGIANIYGATYPKLEYHLRNDYLIFNELGNLKKDEIHEMQQFLLATGAYFNSYEKKSRKTADGTTSETYDISRKSLGIFYNKPSYYTSRGQQFFDTMFQPAVIDRFIPFLFDGVLTTDFESSIHVKEIVNENDSVYKNVISTVSFYIETYRSVHNKYKEIIDFDNEHKRYKRTFNTISKYISHYAKDENEYKELVTELFKCYENYQEEISEILSDEIVE